MDRGSASGQSTGGVVYLHSCPAAVCPHVEWALSSILGERISLEWRNQPALTSTQRAQLEWRGPIGTASAIASALRDWHYLRFEVTEDPTTVSEGARFMCTPDLGIHHSTTGLHGDVMIHENRLLAALEKAIHGLDVEGEIATLLGLAWDEELEPFRQAGDGAPVRWLNRTG